MRRYRDPLLFAADQLVNRIETIENGRMRQDGSAPRLTYAVDSTVFSIAEFLGWIELIRRDQLFLDLGEEEPTRTLHTLLNRICRQLSSDTIFNNDGQIAPMAVWLLNQRAIGELMIEESTSGSRCIGFAAFTIRLHDGRFERHLGKLRLEVESLISGANQNSHRLQAVKATALELISSLDPSGVRVPERDLRRRSSDPVRPS